jgi:anti-sigma factor RsiW
MKGDDFSALLEDYHYGELDDVTAARLMAHLRGCDNCRTALHDLEQENQVYQAYADSIERELDVTPAMWEGVRVRMNEVAPNGSAQAGWFARLGQSLSAIFAGTSPVMRQLAFAAVIVVISVAGTLLVVRMMADKQPSVTAGSQQQNPVPVPETPKKETPVDNGALAGNSGPKPVSPAPQKRQSPRATDDGDQIRKVSTENRPVGDPTQIALEQRIQKLRKEYVEAIDILSASVNKRKSKLDPKLLAVFNRNLNIVNETIAATRKAYASNPADAELAQYMLTAYAKKVELLQEIDSAIASN